MHFHSLETLRLFLIGISNETMVQIFETLPKSEIMNLLGHTSEAEFANEYQKHKNGYSSYNRNFILFLLKDKASGVIIGRCGIHNWNKEHCRAELGYTMTDSRFRKTGRMTEAVEQIIHFGFNNLNINRFEALVNCNNQDSISILEKFQFKKEGRLIQHMLTPNGFEDSFLYALIRK